MNKKQIIDFLLERSKKMEENDFIPTLELLIEELEEEVELENQVKAETKNHD